jgi:hypothetical protein
MNKEQREELKRLAAEATPGPWIAGSDEGSDYTLVGPDAFDEIATNHVVTLHSESNADYIAAANPQAITELIAALEAAEKDAARYKWVRHGDNDELLLVGDCRGVYLPRNERLDEAIDKAMEAK